MDRSLPSLCWKRGCLLHQPLHPAASAPSTPAAPAPSTPAAPAPSTPAAPAPSSAYGISVSGYQLLMAAMVAVAFLVV
ncbi:hypothetical protein CK203_085657 [Vitis vinifera]|uniref:Uncharacterized protein n=1 Tax=Vitis vinifera TaxID=29760 RepID=A0A438BLJ0_VITVI|nr:hypothetical protein CK203_085657 [Vitis vinifera]